jgi:hypothetical protein
MKTKILALVAVFTLLMAVSAHALSYSSKDMTTLSAGQSATFDFSPAKGNFNSAKLKFDVESMTGASTSLLGKSLSSPASGEFFAMTGNTLTYLFTTDFHLGTNVFKLNKFLGALDSANSASGLTLGLLMNRGSVSFDSVRLKGTVAPEPISMALMAAGMVGLPFARRLRKNFAA